MRRTGHSIRASWQASGCGILAGVLLALFGPPAQGGPPPAEDPWTRSELHVKVLMSALTYERSLQHSQAEVLHIGVLFDPASADSLVASTQTITALEHQAEKMTFRGRPIIISGLPLVEGPRMRKAMEAGLHVIYVTEGITTEKLRRVTALTRELKIISITGVEDYVHAGVTLAAVVEKKKPHMIIHLGAARAEGAEFSSQLLQLAEIIGNGESDNE